MFRLQLLLVLMLCHLLTPSLALAQAVVASEVSVDVTGDDPADARTRAMAKGETDALTGLLEKLGPPGQSKEIINSLDAKKISAMVRGTEVLEEKMSANRYRAQLRVTFDGDAINGLLTKATADTASGNLVNTTGAFLVIPVYETDAGLMLWEGNNPWRTVWKSVGLEVTSGDVVVPYGDASDNAIVDTKNISQATFATLSPFTQRYGITDIVIFQAKLTQSPDMVLTVVKRRLNRSKNDVNMLTFRADPQETRDALLTRAARDLVRDIQDRKTEEIATSHEIRGGERNKVMMLANITTMSSWTDLRKKLTSLPMVDRVEMLAISPRQIDMAVHYRGNADSLALAITTSKIRLNKTPDYWVISRD